MGFQNIVSTYNKNKTNINTISPYHYINFEHLLIFYSNNKWHISFHLSLLVLNTLTIVIIVQITSMIFLEEPVSIL